MCMSAFYIWYTLHNTFTSDIVHSPSTLDYDEALGQVKARKTMFWLFDSWLNQTQVPLLKFK